jgi:Flp pilus assembly protein TadB
MSHRLHFLVPGRAEALSVIKDLSRQGINPEHIQVLADKRTRTDGLTQATARQKNDAMSGLEKALWNVNLASFAVALGCFIFLLVTLHLNWWLLLPSSVMAANFIAGLNFSNLPHAHLGEFRDALAHGEILLLVEVPENRTSAIEQSMHRQHPEAAVGGTVWGNEAFGL